MCEMKLFHKLFAIVLKAKYMLIPNCMFVEMMCNADKCDVCWEILL